MRRSPTTALGTRLRFSARQRRWQRILALSVMVGIGTGLLVTAFAEITFWLLDHLKDAPLAMLALAPGAGLAVNAVLLRLVPPGRTSPATSDEYIRNYHDRHTRMNVARLPARFLGGIATLGSGGPLGLEGPSIYLGAALGSQVQHRFSNLFSREESKLLVVAGAAAGVATIFGAPATGVIFALEVPYLADLARRALLPALLAAAAGYVTSVTLTGTETLFAVAGSPPLDARDLGGALLVGILAGVGARSFAVAIAALKRWSGAASPALRIVAVTLIMAGLLVAAKELFEAPLSVGPGYAAVEWALDGDRTTLAVLALLGIRAIGTLAIVGGGGTGGLFIPLVVLGTLLGRVTGGLLDATSSALFPMLGLAAFLGAGYHAPLAAVVFVAESTGTAGYVVPALIASAVSQLVIGRRSVTEYQRGARSGHLERRFSLPIASAIQTDIYTVPPTATLQEFLDFHLLGARHRSVPVVEGGRYVGVMRLEEMEILQRDEWPTTLVSDAMRTDLPTGDPGWKIRQGMEAMEAADVDLLPIVDAEGRLIGIVTTRDIIKLDDILEVEEGRRSAR